MSPVTSTIVAQTGAPTSALRRSRRTCAHHLRQVRELPPRGRGCADVAPHLRTGPPLGPSDQEQGDRARDAAVGRRPQGKPPDAQRHQPVGRADPDHRRLGRCGAPRGDLADMPPAPTFATGWTYERPDAILEMPVEFDIPAEGELGVQMFYSKVPWRRIASPRSWSSGPATRRSCITPASSSSTSLKVRVSSTAASWGPTATISDRGRPAFPARKADRDRASCSGRRAASIGTGRGEAHPGRQVCQLADPLQPDG